MWQLRPNLNPSPEMQELGRDAGNTDVCPYPVGPRQPQGEYPSDLCLVFSFQSRTGHTAASTNIDCSRGAMRLLYGKGVVIPICVKTRQPCSHRAYHVPSQGRDGIIGHTADQGQDENLGIQRYISEETWWGPKVSLAGPLFPEILKSHH